MKTALFEYQPETGWKTSSSSLFDGHNTLLLVFGSLPVEELPTALKLLRDIFPLATMTGCSTAGEIIGDRFIESGLVATAIKFEHCKPILHWQDRGPQHDSLSTGRRLATRLTEQPELQSVFVLSEGIQVNGSQLIKGFNEVLDGKVPVTGGLAGDQDRFQSTWVLQGENIHRQGVCAVGIYGTALGVAYGSRGGWDVLGPERRVTHAQDNILYTLDDQPALALYKKYLGDRASGLPATGLLFPLAILPEKGDSDEPQVRTILGVDEEQQSLTFAGDIPQNRRVQLMRANFERLIDGAEDAVRNIDLAGYNGGDLVCIAISCVGRRLILGPRVDEEIEAVKDALPANARLVGFYSYGELSPQGSRLCDLHNQTMTLTLWWEN